VPGRRYALRRRRRPRVDEPHLRPAMRERALALWMARFYAILLGEGARPSDALRRTRAAMWADPRWSAPSYWSAFELQGDAW